MSKTGLFYGSTTGNTKIAAEQIAKSLDIDNGDVIDISNASAAMLLNYDNLIFGSSTWGLGDLQDDWEGFISDLESADLSGKKVAVFGTGDSSSYPDTFCDAVGIIAQAAQAAGATLAGQGTSPADYTFDDSKALDGDAFCGLPLDEDNESGKTSARINAWVEKLKAQMA